MTRERLGSTDLLVDVLGSPDDPGRLRELVDGDDRVPDATEVMAYGELNRLYEEEDETPPDVAIAATVVTGGSSRRNHRTEKTVVVEVEVSASKKWLRSRGTLVLHQMLDAVTDELETHSAEWTALGQSGGADPPLPDDDRNRYLGVRRFDFERID